MRDNYKQVKSLTDDKMLTCQGLLLAKWSEDYFVIFARKDALKKLKVPINLIVMMHGMFR